MQPLAENLWVVHRPFRFLGLPLGTRMTVVRLANGELWVHSAFDPGPEILEQLRREGPVRHVVCPNRLHHVLVTEFTRHFPEAQLYVSAALPRKRPDLAHGLILGDVAPQAWQPDLESLVLRGHVYLDEVLFFHRPSRTLILTDLLECIDEHAPWYMRVAGKLLGIFQRHGPPLDMRATFRPAEAARVWLERVLEWDFDRIVLAHGPLVETGGHEVFRKAYDFLLQ